MDKRSKEKEALDYFKLHLHTLEPEGNLWEYPIFHSSGDIEDKG